MKATLKLNEVKRGDIVRFKSYSLRVESEPIRLSGTGIKLQGRTSINGCPFVTKSFLDGAQLVTVERSDDK